MSGGRYEYLFLKEAPELLTRLDLLREMEADLRARGQTNAADRVQEFLQALEVIKQQAETLTARMKDALHAAEWYGSFDWGEDQLNEIFQKLSEDCS